MSNIPKIAIKSDGTKETGAKIIKFLEFLGGKHRFGERFDGNMTNFYYYINKDGYIDYGLEFPFGSDIKIIELPNVIFQDEMGNDVYDYLCPVQVVIRKINNYLVNNYTQYLYNPKNQERFAHFIHKTDADAFIEKNKQLSEELKNDVDKLFDITDNSKQKSMETKVEMKPFDLELAKQGHPVCIKVGRIDVEILCFDLLHTYPIVAKLMYDKENQDIMQFKLDGESSSFENYNLMMKVVMKEGWINLFKLSINGKIIAGTSIYNTEDEAKEASKHDETYITTIPIKWEDK